MSVVKAQNANPSATHRESTDGYASRSHERITLANETVAYHVIQRPIAPMPIDQICSIATCTDIALEPKSATIITIPAVTPGTYLPLTYMIVCNDDLGQLEHYVRAFDEAKRVMRVLVRNSSDSPRSILFKWF